MSRRWIAIAGISILAALIIVALVLSRGGGSLSGAAQPFADPTVEPDPTQEMCETTEGVIPCDEVCEDSNGDLIRCRDENENENQNENENSNDNNENAAGGGGVPGGGEPAPRGCAIWVPDVGDAKEKGLIATDADPGMAILIATDEEGQNIVARIEQPYVGTDTFQVPEQYRKARYWFAVEGCGRWHGGQELGFED